jgi:hypothetical protein
VLLSVVSWQALVIAELGAILLLEGSLEGSAALIIPIALTKRIIIKRAAEPKIGDTLNEAKSYIKINHSLIKVFA